jgi:hypothetical protein
MSNKDIYKEYIQDSIINRLERLMGNDVGDDVERITGYDFFPALPDSIEDVVEAHSNIEDWKLLVMR